LIPIWNLFVLKLELEMPKSRVSELEEPEPVQEQDSEVVTVNGIPEVVLSLKTSNTNIYPAVYAIDSSGKKSYFRFDRSGGYLWEVPCTFQLNTIPQSPSYDTTFINGVMVQEVKTIEDCDFTE
jgi:hypothetical protein